MTPRVPPQQHVPPPRDESVDYARCVHHEPSAYFYCTPCKMLMCSKCWVEHLHTVEP